MNKVSKICGLIKNELIKQYKKVSFKVMIILILLVSIALPVAIKFFNDRDNSNYYKESYNQDIQYRQSDIEKIDISKKNKDIKKKAIEENIKMTKTLIECNVSWDDWRSQLAYDAASKAKEAIVLSGIIEGFTSEQIFDDFYELDPNMFTNYFNLTKEELQVEVDAKIKKSEELYTTVKKNDYLAYIEESMRGTQEEIKTAKLNIDEIKKNIEKEPNNAQLVGSLDEANLQLAMMEERLEVTKYRYDNKIPYDGANWKNNTVRDIANNIDQKGEKLLSETEFVSYNSNEAAKGYTYEEYKKDHDEKIKSIEENIALDWYSLKNEIPQVEFQNDIRNSVDKTYLIYVSISILLCIIIGGGIVSSEYSTGTIRLLMIRPVSRWKIILSKLVALFIIGYVVLITAVILNILTSGILYGFGGLGTKVLAFSGGTIVEQNFVISIIPKLLFSSISLIFIIALTFAISTIVKNTALAVGLTTVAFLGSSVATMILANLKMSWIEKTILPYMNLSTFVSNPNYVREMKSGLNLVLNPTMGAIQLTVVAVMLFMASFIVFGRRDVKN